MNELENKIELLREEMYKAHNENEDPKVILRISSELDKLLILFAKTND